MATITEPAPIHRNLEQRRDALRRANGVRLARAQVKREFRAGERTFAQTLADPPDCILRTAVGEVLQYKPLWGPSRVEKLLDRVPEVTALTRVVDLTGTQWRTLRLVVQAEEARR